MGNKRTRAKRNIRRANNWRGIIKLRKVNQKKNVSSGESCHGRAQRNNEVIINETIQENCRPRELQWHQETFSDSVVFNDFIETEENYENDEGQLDEEVEIEQDHRSEADNRVQNQYESDGNFENSDSGEHIEIEQEHRSDIDNGVHNQYENADSFENGDSNEHDQSGSITSEESRSRYDIENEYLEDEVNFSGRRIVDIGHIFRQVKNLIGTSEHFGSCNFGDMEPTKEIKKGLRSVFEFRCTSCGLLQMVESCVKSDDTMNVNEAAVLGMTSTGHGFYHLEEFFAHLDIPCMSNKTFDAENKKLQSDWWNLAKIKAEEALQEEIKLAISLHEVDECGNALIPVVCDGSWGKRSYGKGFTSLSGCAVIIGLRTKKIIYFDAKNKYCHTCKLSYSKTCPPNNHPCNINYVGPSAGMETTIIIEGFQACERLGARFNKFISDGDSSSYKRIRELGIYSDPDLFVEKFECVNHLFRNFRKHFEQLNQVTKYKKTYRKLITMAKGLHISTGIRMAADHWRESNLNAIDKLRNLEKDCINAPYHYFGQHDKCQSYFCQKTTTPECIENINLMKEDGLFYSILDLCQNYFASNVKSLLADYTNNAAEEFNNIVAKNLGGKRINYSLAGSYNGRIATSVVQYNSEGHSGSELHQFKYDYCSESCIKLENGRKRKLAANARARQAKPRVRNFDKSNSNVDYGGIQTADLLPDQFELSKMIQLDKLNRNQVNRVSIQVQTTGQKFIWKWREIRNTLLNSSYFGTIINARGPKSYTNILNTLLNKHPEYGKTAIVRHQRLYEDEALEAFSSIYHQHNLEECGIFIDKDINFLGASPLRLYGNDSIVVVKCPVKLFRKSIDEAINSKKLNFWKQQNGNVLVNEKSDWHIEIQGKLHITDRQFAYLVVWLGENEFKVEKVTRDDNFWEEKMKPKLQFFFSELMIKELTDSRTSRNMKLRIYDPQKNTFV